MATGTIEKNAGRIQSIEINGTTDSDGDIATTLNINHHSIISCVQLNRVSGNPIYFAIPSGATVGYNYLLKIVNDANASAKNVTVKFRVDYIDI